MGKAIPNSVREWSGVMHGSLVLSLGCKCLRKTFCIFLAHVFEKRMGFFPLSIVKLRIFERGPEKLGQFLPLFTGIGVLDFLNNGSVAYFDYQGQITLVRALAGMGFGISASGSDWIFGLLGV